MIVNKEIENLQDKIHSFANDDNYKEDYSLFRIGDVEKALDEIRHLYFKIEKYQQENARLKDKNKKALELLQILQYNFPDYDDMHEKIEDIEKILKEN